MKIGFKIFVLSLLVSVTSSAHGVDLCNCFCVIAGRNATADGSVILAHNEDDSGEMLLNMYVVDRNSRHNKYLWAEFPGTRDCDHFLNEWGVAIASDGCPSREDREDVTDGGVLYETRLTVAQKAHSAREAVKIIGTLIETRGYIASGRTYVIADPREGWICSVVKGRHWVAKRIPDDEVMALPNNYIIDEVNLSDTLNFYGAKDIETYAIARGWYNPEKDGRFSFKKAYCDPYYYTYEHNVIRQLCAQQYLMGLTLSPNPDSFPFSVKPNRKLTIEDMMQIMSCHGENSEHKFVYKKERKWNHPVGICTDVTLLSAIFQLRSDLPRDIGCILWLCAGRPCFEPYYPWYLGMTRTPEYWRRYSTVEEALKNHFAETEHMRTLFPNSIYWKGVERWEQNATSWYENIEKIQKRRDNIQNKVFKSQAKFDKRLKEKYSRKPLSVLEQAQRDKELNTFTDNLYRKNR